MFVGMEQESLHKLVSVMMEQKLQEMVVVLPVELRQGTHVLEEDHLPRIHAQQYVETVEE